MPALCLSSLCCDKPGAVFIEMLCAQSVSCVRKVRDTRAILFKIFFTVAQCSAQFAKR